MAKLITVQGTTSLITHVFAQSAGATNGVGFTGLSFSASGLVAAYIRAGQAAHSLITLTGSGLNLGTYVSGAWLEVSSGTMPGVYEFHIPDAALTSSGGLGRVVIMIQGNASIAPIPLEIQLDPPNGIFTPMLAASTHSGATIPVVLNINTCTTVLGGTIGFASTAGTVLAGTIGFASTAGVVLGGTIAFASTAGLVTLIATSGIPAVAFQDNAISAAAVSAAAANEIADATFDRVDAIETGLTFRQSQRLVAAGIAGKLTGGATTTIVIRNAVTDDKNRITATVDASGNRSAITYDLT